MFRVRFGRKWRYCSENARVEPNGVLCVLFDGEYRRFDSAYWQRVKRNRIGGKRRKKALTLLIRQAGGPICAICKKQFTRAEITLDHIKPLSIGGTNRIENLQLACRPCNKNKGSTWEP